MRVMRPLPGVAARSAICEGGEQGSVGVAETCGEELADSQVAMVLMDETT